MSILPDITALLNAADDVIRHYTGATPDEPLLSHGDIEALDIARAEVLDAGYAALLHRPGDPHDYRIACSVCGEKGILRVSVDPEYVTSAEAQP